MRQSYVGAFMFDNKGKKVALIRKINPKWQKGLLNAIGGKIEANETPNQAIIREFKEETGVEYTDFKKFCELSNHSFCVHFFKAFTDKVFEVKTIELEQVEIHNVSNLKRLKTIPNLKWLIPMAIDDTVLYSDTINVE